MENIEETTKSKSNTGFFKHVFNFDEDSKNELMNIVQYAVLAIVPVIILNKSIQKFVPPADEEKGSPEILAEVLFQTLAMFIGILLIHRIISYVPTYSETDYAKFNTTNIIIIFLVIVLSLQTKLGEKANILLERFSNLISGDTSLKEKPKKQSGGVVGMSNHQPSRADERDNTSSQYPTSLGDMALGNNVQQAPNFNSMYAGPNTPLVNAAQPGQDMYQEPMAANGALGGSFGSAF